MVTVLIAGMPIGRIKTVMDGSIAMDLTEDITDQVIETAVFIM